MSRHKIRGFIKQPVERTITSKATTERKVLTNPVTGELEVVHITTPAAYKQGKAQGPTTHGGNRNTPDNMAPKGRGGAAPITRSKK